MGADLDRPRASPHPVLCRPKPVAVPFPAPEPTYRQSRSCAGPEWHGEDLERAWISGAETDRTGCGSAQGREAPADTP